MKFLMMIKHAELTQPFQPPQSLNDAMGAFVSEGFTKGWLKDTAGLKPTKEGVRIRQKGGKLKVTDGPFTEAKGDRWRLRDCRDQHPGRGAGDRPSFHGAPPHSHSRF